jgi:hypothetical protein
MVAAKANLYQGENVRHKAKADWGIGKIVLVETCGTIKVIFGGQQVSIAQGAKYLIKVDKNRNEMNPPQQVPLP